MGGFGNADDFYGPLLGGSHGKPGDMNLARFWNEDLAKQVEEASKEPSADKRKAIFENLEKTVFDKHRPLVPLFTTTMAGAWRADWTGIRVNSIGDWRFETAAKR